MPFSLYFQESLIGNPDFRVQGQDTQLPQQTYSLKTHSSFGTLKVEARLIQLDRGPTWSENQRLG